ncbi:MAG: choice-of-anchor tandem repeat NxxGxxAF-containing protein [Acidobacteriota bacterium]
MRHPLQAVLLVTGLVWASLGTPWAASGRVPVGIAMTGDAAAGGVIGGPAFPYAPTIDGSDGSVLFVARLIEGAAAHGILATASDLPTATRFLSGDGTTPARPWLEFLPPAACSPGMTFWTRLAPGDPSAPGASGLLLVVPGQEITVARTGDPAPGGGNFLALGAAPQIDTAGQVVFLAAWSDATGSGSGIYRRRTDGVMERLLRSGDPAPGGGLLADIGTPVMSCDGRLAVTATVDETTTFASVLLSGTPAMLEPVLTTGQPLPGGGHLLDIPQPAALGADSELFVVVVDDLSGGALLRIDAGGVLSVAARVGDASPRGSTLAALGRPTALAPGQAAVRAELSDGTGFPPGAMPVIILGSPAGATSFDELLAVGDVLADGSRIDDLGAPAGDGAGHFAVVSQQTGTGLRAEILQWSSTGLTRLAGTGDTIDGGQRLLDGGFASAVPAVLSDGRVAFVARLQGAAAPRGLFLAGWASPPALLVAEGDEVPGSGPVASLDGSPTPIGAADLAIAVSMGAARTPAYLLVPASGSPTIRLAAGSPTPLGGTFRTLGRAADGAADGRLTFTATLSGTAASSGVFVSAASGSTSTVAQAGETAPGGETFTSFGFSPSGNAPGTTAFLAFLSGGTVGSGIFTAAGAAPAGAALPVPVEVARSGTPAPGGGSFTRLYDPVESSTGAVAFLADLDTGGRGLFRWQGGVLDRLLGTGDGLTGAGTISGLTRPRIDATDVVAVLADVAGAGFTQAVLSVSGSGIPADIVATDGETVAPGLSVASIGALAAGPTPPLTAAVDLEGWSPGAAVVSFTPDGDGDGSGDPVDCAPTNPGVFAVPPGVTNLRVALSDINGSLDLAWDSVGGAAGSASVHDILSGSVAMLTTTTPFGDASCVASDLPAASTTVPGGGGDLWFLARGRNTCGQGTLDSGDPSPAAGAARAALDGLSCSP